jgi:hypothetical protein
MPFSCHVRDDGIFVIEALGVIKAEDVPSLREAEQKFFASRGPDAPVRFLCDCSGMKVISPEASDVLLELMRDDTPRIVRSAYVVGDGVNALQLKRMIRQVGSNKRRIFTRARDAIAWLAEQI